MPHLDEIANATESVTMLAENMPPVDSATKIATNIMDSSREKTTSAIVCENVSLNLLTLLLKAVKTLLRLPV